MNEMWNLKARPANRIANNKVGSGQVPGSILETIQLNRVAAACERRMSIKIPAELETRLRAQAKAEGITVEAYIERLVRADERAEEELTALALEGLNSGEAVEGSADYWEGKHRRLDERLKKTGSQ